MQGEHPLALVGHQKFGFPRSAHSFKLRRVLIVSDCFFYNHRGRLVLFATAPSPTFKFRSRLPVSPSGKKVCWGTHCGHLKYPRGFRLFWGKLGPYPCQNVPRANWTWNHAKAFATSRVLPYLVTRYHPTRGTVTGRRRRCTIRKLANQIPHIADNPKSCFLHSRFRPMPSILSHLRQIYESPTSPP